MPYTRNTRIKVITKKNSVEHIAQVEYRLPIIGSLHWEDIDTIERGHFKDDTAFTARRNCLWNESLDDTKGQEWAKALIDEYLKLLDENEHVDIVEYIKYP